MMKRRLGAAAALLALAGCGGDGEKLAPAAFDLTGRWGYEGVASAGDELQHLHFGSTRHPQAWREAGQVLAAPDDTRLAVRVLRQVGYPPAPELLREVARLIRELNALCPHFPPAAIARDLVRRYEVPWLHVEAQAHRVGMRPEAYGLFMLRIVHGTMLLDARHTDCEGR